jgi:hypothetical protein
VRGAGVLVDSNGVGHWFLSLVRRSAGRGLAAVGGVGRRAGRQRAGRPG